MSKMKTLTWYCPQDGLEHRCLLLCGWTQMYILYIEGEIWVRMRKEENSVLLADALLLTEVVEVG